ncbi:MAG: GAF domain-containing protein [Nitrospinae bacterium]|nr:GAF domain-containing protein [Nitrospinota bacterium]
MTENNRITELETELKRLKEEIEGKDCELERLKGMEHGMEDERRAMLYMLEDLNRSKTEIERSEESLKGEMEITTHLLMIAEETAHATDIDGLIERVIHCTRRLTGCDICLFYLWDNKDRKFTPAQQMGLKTEMTPQFRTKVLDEGIEPIKRTLEGKVPVIIKNPPESPFDKGGIKGGFSWLPDINTLAVIPLIGKRRYLGIIICIYSDIRDITDRDMKVIKGISHQVSTALEDARLYRDSIDKAIELSGKIETIRVMHEIDRAVLSTLNRNEILEITITMISRVVHCEMAAIFLVDKDRGGFLLEAGNLKKGFMPFQDTSLSEVVDTMMPQYVNNLSEVSEILPLERSLLEAGFLSHLRVPLMVRGEVIGVLCIGAKTHSAFTTENLSVLENLASQMSIALENSRLIIDLEDLFVGTVKSLSSAIDAKSKWTAGHSERVTKYAIDIGKGIGLLEKGIKDIELGGLLHDIGKLGTYEAILDKAGRLTDEEFNLIKQHPVKGAEILSPIKQIRHVIPIVRHHHERYDGKGYPDGLKGEEIPLMARIMCIADSVDAMGADRPYRKGLPMDVIVGELKKCSGSQFDPAIVDIFLKIF